MKKTPEANGGLGSSNSKQRGNHSMKTDYVKQVLAEFGLEFRAVLVGNDCPGFCEDALKDRAMDEVDTYPRKTHIHGKHYRCTISGKGRGHVGFDFWNSYADEERNYFIRQAWAPWHFDGLPLSHPARKYKGLRLKDRAQVTAYDLLACITKNDPGTFENFCGDFGYDTDSRRAEKVYEATREEWRKVERFFKPEELEKIQEVT